MEELFELIFYASIVVWSYPKQLIIAYDLRVTVIMNLLSKKINKLVYSTYLICMTRVNELFYTTQDRNIFESIIIDKFSTKKNHYR